MAVLSLALIAVWLALVAGLRGYLLARRTGGSGVRFRDRPGSAQWWARLISAVGFVLMLAAPVAELGGLRSIAVLDNLAVRILGVALVVLGIAATVGAQAVMGASWRGDVDPEARTALVTTGPFRWVRNPIFTASATTALGFTLMVPNVLGVVMLIAFLTAYQIQVRLVEEPYLRRVHGGAYSLYAQRTGRFLPWIGRERPCR